MASTGVAPTPALSRRLEGEGTSRSTHFKHIADVYSGMHVCAGRAVYLLLDADAVVIGRGCVGERVVAQEGWGVWSGFQAQDDKLAREGRCKGLFVGWHQDQRAHAVALPFHL
jgi:hypothetical protein